MPRRRSIPHPPPAAALVTATLAAGLALLPASAEAGGDAVYGTRGGEQLSEREHLIELRFDRGHATLRVQRTFHNGIDRHEEAQAWINLPQTAVATGLRTLGQKRGKPYWFEADLLEAEAAAARYTELTGLGGYYPKDPALLSWRDQTLLALQVFPVAPQTAKTVDYTLTMPAHYEAGRWSLELPALGTDTLAATLVLDPANRLDQLFLDGEVIANGHQLELDRHVSVALAPRDPEVFGLALASVPTGEDRELIHWRVTLAPKISTIPKHARIVIVLDLSRSRDGAIEAQRSAALATLEHFLDPALDAEVAVLGFHHEVVALSSGFVAAAEARAALEQANLTTRNGSEVGLALAAADALLAKAGKGPRRILLLSDFETAARLKPEDLEQTVAHSEAIVHLGVVDEGSARLERDDGHPWADLAAGSEGVLWSAAVGDLSEPDERAAAVAVFEEWARPVRVDHFALRLDGLAPDDYALSFEPSLAEGEGFEELLLTDVAARALAFEGRLWNAPLERSAKPSRSEGDRWAALVFGSPLLYTLSEAEMMTLALRGGAVSPVTSFLAIEPGVRPSTEGLEAWERGFGTGDAGGGRFGLSARVGRSSTGPVFDKRAWIEGEVGDAWRRCGGAEQVGSIELETMTAELLDVALPQAAAPDSKLGVCVMQLLWNLDLPGHFQARERWSIAT